MKVVPNHPDAYKLIHDGLLALSEASMQGMCIDTDYCKKMDIILTKRIRRLKEKIESTKMGRLWRHIYQSSMLLNSDTQLANVVFNKLKAKVVNETESGLSSTDQTSLLAAQETVPELAHLLEYRKLSKVQGTYIQKFLKETVDGVMHPSFNLHTVVTYRSSSNNPNFQNIPNRDKELRKIARRAFIPRKGHQLMAADFSGIEVCISCCNHLDPKMIEYVKYPEKNNMHTDMAVQLYMLDKFQKEGAEKTLRKGAKNGFVFPQFYGDYYGNNAPSLMQWANMPSDGAFDKKQGLELMTGKTVGQHLIDKGVNNYRQFLDHVQDVQGDFWTKRFKVYNNWKKKNVAKYYRKGHLNLLTGFTCSGFIGQNDINNYPIQGAAFHCLLKTFIKLNQEIKARGLKSRLIGQIHDEVVLDAHPSEIETLKSLLRWIACEWLLDEWKWIIVPMEIETSLYDVDANWATDSEESILRAA